MVETTLAEPAEGALAFNEFFEALERRLESFGEVGRKIKALKRRSNTKPCSGSRSIGRLLWEPLGGRAPRDPVGIPPGGNRHSDPDQCLFLHMGARGDSR